MNAISFRALKQSLLFGLLESSTNAVWPSNHRSAGFAQQALGPTVKSTRTVQKWNAGPHPAHAKLQSTVISLQSDGADVKCISAARRHALLRQMR